MVQWRSPTVKVVITSVLSKGNDDISRVENNHDNENQIACTPYHNTSKSTSTIKLPTGGYYGFCLEKCASNNACTCDIVFSTAVPEEEQAQQSSIGSQSTHNQSNMATETFPRKLPFEDEENELITSIHIGRKLYVSGNNNTSVTVSCTHCVPCQQSVDSTAHKKKRTSWKWCMVLVKSHTANSSDPQVMKEESLSKVEQEKKNNVVCAVCGRLFDTCRDVQRHLESSHTSTLTHQKHQKLKQQLHKNQEDISSFTSNIWTTPLEVVYQDDSLAVVNKPQGMAVMGAQHSLIKSDLLLQLAWTKENSTCGTTVPIKKTPSLARPLRKPIPVHRLDSATGGLLVVAKTKETEILLKDSFSDRTCHKRYRALVCGRLLGNNLQCDTGGVEQTSPQDQSSIHSAGEGVCSELISGKKALTKYRIVKHCRSLQTPQQDCWVTVVDLYPITGRRHQLRRHMKSLGHPIWGDRRYGYNDTKQKCQEEVLVNGADDISQETTSALVNTEHPKNIKLAVRKQPFSRLCLWAVEISFPHPITGEKMIVCQENEPRWLMNLVQDQEQLWAENQDNLAN